MENHPIANHGRGPGGPKTAEGKKAVRSNALKHGLLSNDVLLPDEEEADFRHFRMRLWADLAPEGSVECCLADRIVFGFWRLHRCGRVEASFYAREFYGELSDRCRREAGQYEKDPFDGVGDGQITDPQKHAFASVRAREWDQRRDRHETEAGATFGRDADGANVFEKIARYEAAFERSVFRCLHELERRQALRNGQHVPLPMAVDVNVHGSGRSDDAG